MAQVRVQPVRPCPHPWPSSDGFRRFPNGPKSNRGHRLGHHIHVHVHDSACACRVHMPEHVLDAELLQVLPHSHALTALCPG